MFGASLIVLVVLLLIDWALNWVLSNGRAVIMTDTGPATAPINDINTRGCVVQPATREVHTGFELKFELFQIKVDH